MEPATVFDRYGSINESRKSFLERLLTDLKVPYDLRTALDVGCGIGFFSECLRAIGLEVKGTDARSSNIADARTRFPSIPFFVHDVEDKGMLEMGTFDFVLCFGLLYHLENPFAAIRHLRALTRKILLVESMISPQPLPGGIFIDEVHEADQALHYVALVPSEAGLTKMLYRAGFSRVYKPLILPDHEQFKETLTHRRRRIILVACDFPLSFSKYNLQSEPTSPDLWGKRYGAQFERLRRFLRKPKDEKINALKRFVLRR